MIKQGIFRTEFFMFAKTKKQGSYSLSYYISLVTDIG